MRANSPVDDLSVLNPVEDEAPEDKIDPYVKLLAKAAKSEPGKIILDHLRKRKDDYETSLKNADFSAQDPTTTAVQVMTAQAVIKEFGAVLNDVDIAIQSIKDANAK